MNIEGVFREETIFLENGFFYSTISVFFNYFLVFNTYIKKYYHTIFVYYINKYHEQAQVVGAGADGGNRVALRCDMLEGVNDTISMKCHLWNKKIDGQ